MCHQHGTTVGQVLWPVPGNQHLAGYGPWQWQWCCPSHTMPTLPWVSRELLVAPQDPGVGSMAGTSAPCRARPVGARGGCGEPGACWEGSQDPSDGFVGSSRTRTSPGRRDTQPPPSSAAGWGRAAALLSGALRTPFPRNPYREWGGSPSSLAALWGEWLPPPWGHWAPPKPRRVQVRSPRLLPCVSVGAVEVWMPQQHPPLDETLSSGTTQPSHPLGWRRGGGDDGVPHPAGAASVCQMPPKQAGAGMPGRARRAGGGDAGVPMWLPAPHVCSLCSW